MDQVDQVSRTRTRVSGTSWLMSQTGQRSVPAEDRDERKQQILTLAAGPHRQQGQQILDPQLRLQPPLEEAYGLVLQVVVGADPAGGQGLDGALVLEGEHKHRSVRRQAAGRTGPAERPTSWMWMQQEPSRSRRLLSTSVDRYLLMDSWLVSSRL